jgi:hypothetical protein
MITNTLDKAKLENCLIAISNPHFLEWVGRLFLDRELGIKQKQFQISIQLPQVWYIVHLIHVPN